MHVRPALMLAIACLAACATPVEIAAVPQIANELNFAVADGQNLTELDVSLVVAGDDDGETVFQFPETWGPEEDLGALRQAPVAVDAASSASLSISESGNQITVTHAPGERIRLSWTVKQDYDGLPQWGVQRIPGMRPVLQTDHASIIGHTILPVIEGRDPEMVVSFDGIPVGAAFSQPAPDGRSSPVALSVATDSMYALGAYTFGANADTNVRTALIGEWALSNEEIAATTSAVIDSASTAFRSTPPHQYFVAITPLPELPNSSTVIGTALNESFFILATRNASAENLNHTIVHEILHAWITGRMGTTDEATDPARMWFTEGFTEYYTQLILLDSGQVSLEGFLKNLNELWAAYQESPVQTMPSSELLEHVWDSRDTERLPYQRGALLALHWEMLASARGSSLADALAGLIDRADAARKAGLTAELTDAAITEALSQTIGPEFKQDLSDHIEQGHVIQPADLKLPDCLTVQRAGKDGPASLALAQGSEAGTCRDTLLRALRRPG